MRTEKSWRGKKKSLLGHFAGAVLVAIAMVALFNHFTGFEYSYNGRALGYVKNQEDVLKILDLVSDELTRNTALPSRSTRTTTSPSEAP